MSDNAVYGEVDCDYDEVEVDDRDGDDDGDDDVSGIAVWPTMPALLHLCRYDSGRSRRINMMMMIYIL